MIKSAALKRFFDDADRTSGLGRRASDPSHPARPRDVRRDVRRCSRPRRCSRRAAPRRPRRAHRRRARDAPRRRSSGRSRFRPVRATTPSRVSPSRPPHRLLRRPGRSPGIVLRRDSRGVARAAEIRPPRPRRRPRGGGRGAGERGVRGDSPPRRIARRSTPTATSGSRTARTTTSPSWTPPHSPRGPARTRANPPARADATTPRSWTSPGAWGASSARSTRRKPSTSRRDSAKRAS